MAEGVGEGVAQGVALAQAETEGEPLTVEDEEGEAVREGVALPVPVPLLQAEAEAVAHSVGVREGERVVVGVGEALLGGEGEEFREIVPVPRCGEGVGLWVLEVLGLGLRVAPGVITVSVGLGEAKCAVGEQEMEREGVPEEPRCGEGVRLGVAPGVRMVTVGVKVPECVCDTLALGVPEGLSAAVAAQPARSNSSSSSSSSGSSAIIFTVESPIAYRGLACPSNIVLSSS